MTKTNKNSTKRCTGTSNLPFTPVFQFSSLSPEAAIVSGFCVFLSKTVCTHT